MDVAFGGWSASGKISSMVEIRVICISFFTSAGMSSRSRRFCEGMSTCLMPARWAAG